MASSDPSDDLACSVCLVTCCDLVPLPCGHVLCQVCADRGASEALTCPQCPNRAVELPKDQSRHEPTEDLCNSRNRPAAARACLPCQVSPCEDHLRDHTKSEEQVLTKPSSICPVHKKALLYYCCHDEKVICHVCSQSEEHQTHQTKPVAEASKEKEQLGRALLDHLTSEFSEDKKQGENLQERRRTVEDKFVLIKEKVGDLFRDLRRQLEDLEMRVLSEISQWEEQASLSISDLIQRLDIKMEHLSSKIRHIEELCEAADPISVLKNWRSIKDHCGPSENGSNVDREPRSINDAHEGLISATLLTGLSDIMTDVKKGFYVQQDPDFALDKKTAANDICVSEDLKTASSSEIVQSRPRVPERFQYNQVLSSKSVLSGRHYWELETGEGGNWRLGVTYPTTPRKGFHSLIGHSNKSWGLCRYFNQYMAVHDKRVMALSHKPLGHRLGVYLDYEAGYLSFYELSDPIRHLHTFCVNFSEPLHLALGVYTGWVKIRN